MADTEKIVISPLSPSAESRHASEYSLKIKKEDDSSVIQHVELSENNLDEEDDVFQRPDRRSTFVLAGTALVILAWWISSLLVHLTRSQPAMRTILAWFFALVIAFRFIPASVVSRPVAAVWTAAIGSPMSRIPSRARLALAWLGALVITFCSAFGFERPEGTAVTDRIISLAGVFFCQLIILAQSVNRKDINWTRIPISIILQQTLAIFVLKCDWGFKILGLFNAAVAGFQAEALEATAAIFDHEVAEKNWLFAMELCLIIFFAAVVKMLSVYGWMQWITKQFAWFGARVMGASGAETFVAICTPWLGQVISLLLVIPYIENMTDSEIFSVVTTSMASISSLLIQVYSSRGATSRNLIAQSMILIPGALMNAKIAFPEPNRDVVATRSRGSTHAHNKMINLTQTDKVIEALSDGAWLGLRVAASALANLLMLLAIFIVSNPILIWIFRGFGIKAIDINIVVAAPLAPFTFFLGVPRREVWRLSILLAQRINLGPNFAVAALAKVMKGPQPLSHRGFSVIQFAMASSASFPSMALQLGAMVALAPKRKRIVAKLIMPAVLVATVSSYQAAAIAATML